MSDEVLTFPKPYATTQFQEWHEGMRVIHEERRVPHLRAFQTGPTMWSLVLDGRFGIDGTEEECKKWVWFVANAMAVAAGYSCFGEESGPINPFKPGRLVGIEMPEKETP